MQIIRRALRMGRGTEYRPLVVLQYLNPRRYRTRDRPVPRESGRGLRRGKLSQARRQALPSRSLHRHNACTRNRGRAARDDAEAIKVGSLLMDDLDIEIWVGARCVTRLQPKGTIS
jgi:hypothetical protein